MAPGAKQEALIRTWKRLMLVILEEVSMMPAEAFNMLLYRSMWGRRQHLNLNADEYALRQHLFGGMPLSLLLIDMLQLKPPKQISLADDLIAKARQGSVVSVEAQTAVNAFRGIDIVIELLETRRFKDRELPKIMNFMREADHKPMPQEMWKSLLSRSIEANQTKLDEDLFGNGHVVGIF